MIPIHISNLTKRFGAVAAVDSVTVAIEPGELFFLLGPSGCGKTTLLRCVAGFAAPDGGSIRFADRDVTRVPANRRNTSMVFQSYALWPHMSVADNVAFGLGVRHVPAGERRRRVDDALRMVQLSELASRKPNELSGGQQQRVALARALVVEPDCLLLDEPLSNLDAKLRLEMRQQIREICKRAGLTAIYVTHDQKEALSMADRVAVMRDGRVEQIGTPQEIYRRPGNRFVAGFVGQTNFLSGKVAAIEHGTARIACGCGTLSSRALPDGLSVGREVTCSVRPEAVRLAETAEQKPNRMVVTVQQSVYLGEVAQHQLRADDGVAMEVFEMNPRRTATDGDGFTCECWIDPHDVVVLPE